MDYVAVSVAIAVGFVTLLLIYIQKTYSKHTNNTNVEPITQIASNTSTTPDTTANTEHKTDSLTSITSTTSSVTSTTPVTHEFETTTPTTSVPSVPSVPSIASSTEEREEKEKSEPSEQDIANALREYRELVDSYSKQFSRHSCSDNNSDNSYNSDKAEETHEVTYTDPNMATKSAHDGQDEQDDVIEDMPDRFTKGAVFNPSAIIANGTKKATKSRFELPKVEQLGTISLKKLNEFHCNADRQCLSVLGTVFDVTDAQWKYGPDGSYKSFAGHDISLALGSGKLDEKWLDRFVQMGYKYESGAQTWMGLYQKQYPVCGKLDKWDQDKSKWPRLTSNEKEELDAQCNIM